MSRISSIKKEYDTITTPYDDWDPLAECTVTADPTTPLSATITQSVSSLVPPTASTSNDSSTSRTSPVDSPPSNVKQTYASVASVRATSTNIGPQQGIVKNVERNNNNRPIIAPRNKLVPIDFESAQTVTKLALELKQTQEKLEEVTAKLEESKNAYEVLEKKYCQLQLANDKLYEELNQVKNQELTQMMNAQTPTGTSHSNNTDQLYMHEEIADDISTNPDRLYNLIEIGPNVDTERSSSLPDANEMQIKQEFSDGESVCNEESNILSSDHELNSSNTNSVSHLAPSTSTTPSNSTIDQVDDSNKLSSSPPAPLYTVERKLPPEYLYEDGSVVPRLAKRHLILRCYKANYTVDQCKHYLAGLNLPIKVYTKTIVEWYARFGREGRAGTIADKARSGRPTKVADEALDAYMAAHPRATSHRVGRHFGLSNGSIYRRLKKLGYERQYDRFVKRRPDEPENGLSDEQLFEYKFAHPEAKAKDIGAHFDVSHAWLNERLRRMGFVIPKYVKKYKPVKKRRTNLDAEEQEEEDEDESSSSETDSDTNSDSNSRTRVFRQRKPKPAGRPKGTKNIEHKGLLLHPVLGTPVTDIDEARQILSKARTLTKQEQTRRQPVVHKEGIHKKDPKATDYTKDSPIAISLTEILFNDPMNIPLPPPSELPPKKATPLPKPLSDETPIRSKLVPKRKANFAANATQLTTTTTRKEDPELITIDVPSIDLPENV